jgi:DNA-binding NarL/FixJ family response regulator
MRVFNELHPEIKIIILSCRDEQIVVDECMTADASGFVLQRTVARDLASTLNIVMGWNTYVSLRC